MTDNIYEPPKANLDLEKTTSETAELAGRWQRLGGSIIDALTIMVVTVPLMFIITIMSGDAPSILLSLVIGLLGIGVFAAINFKFLKNDGQTVGKKVVGTKITNVDRASVPEMDQFIKRYAVYMLASQVPVIGGIFALVNALFIFGEEKRCLHDLAGGTVVVRK